MHFPRRGAGNSGKRILHANFSGSPPTLGHSRGLLDKRPGRPKIAQPFEVQSAEPLGGAGAMASLSGGTVFATACDH